MSYVAAVCGKGQEVNKVKEQLLQSNPVLEGESQVHVCSLESLVAGWLSVSVMWLNYPVAKHCPLSRAEEPNNIPIVKLRLNIPLKIVRMLII